MCNTCILKKADSRVKQMEKHSMGITVQGTAYVRYLMSDSLSSVWGHSVHFATFLMLYSKGYSSHSFHTI